MVKKNTILVNLEKYMKKSMAYYRMNKVNMSREKKKPSELLNRDI